MSMGVPVIAPKIAWFEEFMPYDLCFESIEEALSIISRLIKDSNFWLEKSKEARDKIKDLHPSIIAQTFLETFENYLEEIKNE